MRGDEGSSLEKRREPATHTDERATLDGWLDFHRATLLMKCEGLDETQRRSRPIDTSLISLHGLIRHMAEVERNWFQRALDGPADIPSLFVSDKDPDADWYPLDGARWTHDLETWREQCDISRAAVAVHGLDDESVGLRDGTLRTFSLRWIYVHMIEEYARHNGHADLIRELIDGVVGS